MPLQKFEDGDRICFIGDSITHSGVYHAYLYTYYATRFPDKKIEFYNCGIGGHTAGKTLKTFGWDVPQNNPNKSVVMLGMNDLRGKKPNYQTYIKSIEQVLSLISRKTDSSMALMSPTPYDEWIESQTRNIVGFNGVLAKGQEYLSELAISKNISFIDLHTPMTEMMLKKKKQDPKFTLISHDRIHPGRIGHLVMAYLILKSQQSDKYVNKIELSAASKNMARLNCQVDDLEVSEGKVQFKLKSNSLPFPEPENTQTAFGLVPFHEEFNQEILKVTDLPEGTYKLTINQQPVGTYTHDLLGEGVNLAINKNTPQYQQALKIHELIMKKNSYEHHLRTESFLKLLLKNKKISFNGNDPESVTQTFQSPKVKALFAPGGKLAQGAFLRYWKRYHEEKKMYGNVYPKIQELIEQIAVVNNPQELQYSLERIQ